MTTKDNGGPAFPPTPSTEMFTSNGMSLRDYFAAKAMQGLIAQSDGTALGSKVEIGAKYAYEMADAMLKAREQ